MILKEPAKLFCLIISLTLSLPGVVAGEPLETFGDIGQFALPAAALGMTAVYKDGEGALDFIKALAVTEAVTYGLKYTINSERPDGGDHSFPSGHTAAAFAGAAFIQQRYGWDCGVPAYIAATLVGFSRITSKNHYAQDVLAGAAIGIGANLLFTKKYEKKNLTVSPLSLNRGMGIIFSYNW